MKYTTSTEYKGQGRCVTTHCATGKVFMTDLHKEQGGLEENPSPGEMLAATLASCMMSMASFIAARRDIDLTGMKLEAVSVYNDSNEIKKISMKGHMPLSNDHPMRRALELAATTCPVHGALKGNVDVEVEWIWK